MKTLLTLLASATITAPAADILAVNISQQNKDREVKNVVETVLPGKDGIPGENKQSVVTPIWAGKNKPFEVENYVNNQYVFSNRENLNVEINGQKFVDEYAKEVGEFNSSIDYVPNDLGKIKLTIYGKETSIGFMKKETKDGVKTLVFKDLDSSQVNVASNTEIQKIYYYDKDGKGTLTALAWLSSDRKEIQVLSTNKITENGFTENDIIHITPNLTNQKQIIAISTVGLSAFDPNAKFDTSIMNIITFQDGEGFWTSKFSINPNEINENFVGKQIGDTILMEGMGDKAGTPDVDKFESISSSFDYKGNEFLSINSANVTMKIVSSGDGYKSNIIDNQIFKDYLDQTNQISTITSVDQNSTGSFHSNLLVVSYSNIWTVKFDNGQYVINSLFSTGYKFSQEKEFEYNKILKVVSIKEKHGFKLFILTTRGLYEYTYKDIENFGKKISTNLSQGPTLNKLMELNDQPLNGKLIEANYIDENTFFSYIDKEFSMSMFTSNLKIGSYPLTIIPKTDLSSDDFLSSLNSIDSYIFPGINQESIIPEDRNGKMRMFSEFIKEWAGSSGSILGNKEVKMFDYSKSEIDNGNWDYKVTLNESNYNKAFPNSLGEVETSVTFKIVANVDSQYLSNEYVGNVKVNYAKKYDINGLAEEISSLPSNFENIKADNVNDAVGTVYNMIKESFDNVFDGTNGKPILWEDYAINNALVDEVTASGLDKDEEEYTLNGANFTRGWAIKNEVKNSEGFYEYTVSNLMIKINSTSKFLKLTNRNSENNEEKINTIRLKEFKIVLKNQLQDMYKEAETSNLIEAANKASKIDVDGTFLTMGDSIADNLFKIQKQLNLDPRYQLYFGSSWSGVANKFASGTNVITVKIYDASFARSNALANVNTVYLGQEPLDDINEDDTSNQQLNTDDASLSKGLYKTITITVSGVQGDKSFPVWILPVIVIGALFLIVLLSLTIWFVIRKRYYKSAIGKEQAKVAHAKKREN